MDELDELFDAELARVLSDVPEVLFPELALTVVLPEAVVRVWVPDVALVPVVYVPVVGSYVVDCVYVNGCCVCGSGCC